MQHQRNKPVIPVIIGPTASGKTAAAVALADLLPIEVISADSRQIYRSMDIGTATPTEDQLQRCPHHLISFLDITETYSAGQFQKDAEKLIAQILHNGKIPIIVGGSGLYIYALCEGIATIDVSRDKILYYRSFFEEKLQKDGKDALYQILVQVDPNAAKKYSDKNPRRLIRALEFYFATGIPLSTIQSKKRSPCFQPLYFGIRIARKRLYERINNRVLDMIQAGLVQEVQTILEYGYPQSLPPLQTMGYREIILYLQKHVDLDTAIAMIQKATRQYAKRQITWFKKYAPDTHWIESENPKEIAERITYIYEKTVKKAA